jgi:predicted RNA-binding Zn-ribbon protein involved in translation (DUF1610 family)
VLILLLLRYVPVRRYFRVKSFDRLAEEEKPRFPRKLQANGRRRKEIDKELAEVRRHRFIGKGRISGQLSDDDCVPVPRAIRLMTNDRPRMKRGRKGLCPNCGVDLSIEERGTSLMVCPECGFVFRKRQRIEGFLQQNVTIERTIEGRLR